MIAQLPREGDRIFNCAVSDITRIKDEAVNKAGVKRIRVHDLRHSHASYLISHGAERIMAADPAIRPKINRTDSYDVYAPYAPR